MKNQTVRNGNVRVLQVFLLGTVTAYAGLTFPNLWKKQQVWLSPAGWKVGPPRMVALGADGAWFILSEYGAAAWGIPDEFESLAET